MKNVSKKALALLLSLLLILVCCGCDGSLPGLAPESPAETEVPVQPDTPVKPDTPAQPDAEVQAAFDEFLNRQFADMVTEDSFSFDYSLKHPENFGIERIEPKFGEFTHDSFVESNKTNKKALDELNGFTYSALTEEQQLTYDVFKYKLELSLEIGSEDYYYYGVVLSPTLGVNANMPTVFAEYKFNSDKDVDDYLALLTQMNQYFEDVLKFEQERAPLGLFMADFVVDGVVKQCEDFAESKEDSFLLDTFDSRVDELDIPDEQKAAYKEENKKKVLEDVIPAYTNLAEGLKKLKGSGKNDGGLVNFEKGKQFYEILAKSTTGSDKTVTEMADMLDEQIYQAFTVIRSIAQEYPEVLDLWMKPDFGAKEPTEILEHLKEKIPADMPTAADVAYTVKNVHKSLEESVSPAFYMIPPLDDFGDNVIYLNNSKSSSSDYLFQVLAHEGFPGHLYQFTYYFDQNPPPIRYMLDFGGYEEGWATYAEFNSFIYADFPKLPRELSMFLRAYNTMWESFNARADIGVNYEGWSREELANYFSYYGFDEEKMVSEVFESVVEDPANILKYCVGYLEFEELYQYASDELKYRFSAKEFHKSVLDVGPAPFSIVRKAVEQYVSAKKG